MTDEYFLICCAVCLFRCLWLPDLWCQCQPGRVDVLPVQWHRCGHRKSFYCHLCRHLLPHLTLLRQVRRSDFHTTLAFFFFCTKAALQCSRCILSINMSIVLVFSMQGRYRGTVAAFPGRAGGGVRPPWAQEAHPADAGLVCRHPPPGPLHPRHRSGDITDWRIGSLLYLCFSR